MPQSDDWVRFEGYWTTRRSVAMLKEARRLFTKATGRRHPAITQGGLNRGGVSASAGTHDRDALDFDTWDWTDTNQRAWEVALWRVGFAAWWRRYLPGTWSAHNHAVPKGGDLSPGAKRQVVSFQRKRDGLAGDWPYPRIGGYANRTWAGYLAQRDGRKIKVGGRYYPDPGPVKVAYVVNAFKRRSFSVHAAIVQMWLKRLKLYKGAVDGRPGPRTQAALNAFRRSLGWGETDSTGEPGIRSLTLLRDRAKSPRKVVP